LRKRFHDGAVAPFEASVQQGHAANKRKALFLSSWNCSIARVGEGETDFNILSAKPIREKMFRGASSLRFV
jgi:hypothetical protein